MGGAVPPGQGTPTREHLTKLRESLTTRFNESELRTLCFDLGVDYEILTGEAKADKARELVAYLQRRGQIQELVEIGEQMRPDISWGCEGASSKCVLIVEDEANWQALIQSLVQEVANELSCAIRSTVAPRFGDALDEVAVGSYDCVTIDNELLDGNAAKLLIDRIAGLRPRVPVVVVSGEVNPGDVRDFFKHYDVEEFLWKGDFDPQLFKRTLARILAPVELPSSEEFVDTCAENERIAGDSCMDWNTTVSLAISALSPYVAAFGTSAATTTGTKLGEAAFENVKKLWQRIGQVISESGGKSAKQTWEDFKQDPAGKRDALVDVIRGLSPSGDAVLRGYVHGLIQEVELRKGAQLYSLLDNRKLYTFTDVKRICSRISPGWEDELGSNPPREKLARWVVTYAPTRNKWQDLIAGMLEVNPTVMLQ